MASSSEQKFELFSRLPTELRTEIWILAIPRRLITPCTKSNTSAPKPPAISQVCHESRAIALHRGQPCTIDKYENFPSSCWVTWSHDIVLFAGDKTPRLTDDHPILDTMLWSHVSSIVIQDVWTACNVPRKRKSIRLGIWLAARFPQIKEVMIWPQNAKGTLWYDNRYDLHSMIDDEVFGGDSVRLIDLQNSNDVKSIAASLSSDAGGLPIVSAIHWAHRLFHDTESGEETCNWRSLIQMCEFEWVTERYRVTRDYIYECKRAKIKIAERHDMPITVPTAGNFDRNNNWIRDTLAEMPKLRPVFLLARDDGSVHFDSRHFQQVRKSDSRLRSNKTKPMGVFNNEFKLWMKKADDSDRLEKKFTLAGVFNR